jgi:glycosyltransferase involved in cell wall biosynthesis
MGVRISILLATHNGTKYLPELLASLEEQTYRPHEVVCCDDASTDHTVDILESFAARSSIPFKIFVNKKNKGYARNFLEGFQLCGGDYVALCDQDDVWKKEKLEVMSSKISPDMTPSMVFSDCELVDSQLNSLKKTAIGFSKITRIEREKITQGNLLEILIKHPLIPGMCMLVHRTRAILNLPDDPSLMHDYALSAGFSIGGDYSYVDNTLVYYRQHTSNAIGMQNSSNSKKKSKRGPIWDENYAVKANADLRHNLNLFEYLKTFKTTHSLKRENHLKQIDIVLALNVFRLKRRHSLARLICSPHPFKNSISIKLRRRHWCKDFRTNIRLNMNNLLLLTKSLIRVYE